ncbi:hypothetical protein CEUSTIGMA_g8787.t1 [Chlamydomonas eustigma]|uniref:MYND-type domain-containing protein n=1 Tax=Chlamydomonas eustigma TaxID=1157962 RepID=A0A250XE71_9CHLO|nr:hypothetical protein CEUSTIGMA_g8787.t1 [Chlamydomonas eustigma]|eukprot:GAX81356.1 hypothetical protein CEUSTIGMA_g8787.t1 [Chlamydomonas eustigma]
MNSNSWEAELVNDRCHILGLQLKAARIQSQVTYSILKYGKLPLEIIARAHVESGYISRQLELTSCQLKELETLRDRIYGSLTSTSRGSTVQVFGKVASKAYASAAHEHLKEWCELQTASLGNLKDLMGMIEHVPGKWTFLDYVKSAERSGALEKSKPFSWARRVAHLVEKVPEQLTNTLRVQEKAYPPLFKLQGPGSTYKEAPVETDGPEVVLWEAAPYIMDPGSGEQLCVAVHDNLEQALINAGEGDVLLLSPGRYSMPDDASIILRSIHVIGMGITNQEVVLYNDADDDGFMECKGRDVVFENLTMLQVGGYDGIVKVSGGCTTLLDCSLQCSSNGSAAWLQNQGKLVMYNCTVTGSCGSAVQVDAGGTRLEMYCCEVSGCGGGDDLVPRDLGGIEVQVRLRPLSSCGLRLQSPLITADDLQALIRAAEVEWAERQSMNSRLPTSEDRESVNDTGAIIAGAATISPVGGEEGKLEEVVSQVLCQLDDAATIVIGPGCNIHGNKGFAVTVVKERSLALYHESMGGSTASQYHQSGGPNAARSGTAAAVAVATSLGAALEGVSMYVHSGVQLSGNTRGAVGVVDAEYVDMNGDEVNSRTATKHFHSTTLSARQLKEGFFTRDRDWTQVRSACSNLATALAQRRQRLGGLRNTTSALRKLSIRNSKRSPLYISRTAGQYCSSSEHDNILVASQASALRVLLCRCYLQASRLQGQSGDDGRDTSDSEGCDNDDGSDASSSADAEEEYVESSGGADMSLQPQNIVVKCKSREAGPGADSSPLVTTVGGQMSSHEAMTLRQSPVAEEVPAPARINSQSTMSCTADDSSPSIPGNAGDRERTSQATDVDGPGTMPDVGSMGHDFSATKLRRCWLCGKEEPKMKKCSGCRAATYCSAHCQRCDWMTHKKSCNLINQQLSRRSESSEGL